MKESVLLSIMLCFFMKVKNLRACCMLVFAFRLCSSILINEVSGYYFFIADLCVNWDKPDHIVRYRYCLVRCRTMLCGVFRERIMQWSKINWVYSSNFYLWLVAWWGLLSQAVMALRLFSLTRYSFMIAFLMHESGGSIFSELDVCICFVIRLLRPPNTFAHG